MTLSAFAAAASAFLYTVKVLSIRKEAAKGSSPFRPQRVRDFVA
jgi:hypothetical protein